MGGKTFIDNGLDWYLGLFPKKEVGREKLYGDVAVDYFYDSSCLDIVKSHNPHAKFIVILRSPVERTISAVTWLSRRKLIGCDVDKSLAIAIDRYTNGGVDKGDYYYSLIARSMYAEQLKPYISHFPNENIMVIAYDEIKLNPGLVTKKVFGFLGVDKQFIAKSIASKRNVSANIPALIKIERLSPHSKVLSKIMDRLNLFFSERKQGTRKVVVSKDVLNRLENIYSESIDSLNEQLERMPQENVIGLNSFYNWKSK